MYKDKLGRQHGFACPKGPTGPKGNLSKHIFVPGYGSMTPEEYFKFRTEGVVKRKCSDGYIIHFPKDFDSYNFKVFNSEQLEDNLVTELIEWGETQMLKDKSEAEQEQLDAKIKKLEALLTNKDKLKDLKLKDKLEVEQEQLDIKVKKLEAFLANKDKLKDIKFKQIQLLHKQLSGMKTYLEALTERIKNL